MLARELCARAVPWTLALGEGLADRFQAELEPHFRTEEELLAPALQAAGEPALAARLEREHAQLRGLLVAAQSGDGIAALELGQALREHVQFEERELFPTCEARLPAAVLDAVAQRAPK